jgi:phosphoglycerol transferase MdoB-like AlkP superfamily enzyme
VERLYNFLLLSKKLLKVFVLGLIIFTLIKIVFIVRFGNFATFAAYTRDIPLLINNSFRFDIQILAYIFGLPFILNLFALFIKNEKFIRFINSFSVHFIPVLLIISIFIVIADQQFYSFFKLHFNTVTFDFFEEGPRMLLKSIWKDNPVVLIFIISVVLYILIIRYAKSAYSNTALNIDKLKFSSRILIAVLIIILYFVLMRGSIGTFPLQNEDTNVSENEFLNTCVPNPLFCLKEAYIESKKEIDLVAPEMILKKYGYNRIEEAVADYKGINVDSVNTNEIDNIIFSIAHSKKDKKYNVVFFIVESFSNHFIYFHDNKNCNLLGALDKHFSNDIVFRNFQSSGNGTISSLENVIINSPFHSIFISKYRFISYDISIAKPFKDAGYTTTFITGLELGWRHLDEVLKRQYFDNVFGKNYILGNYPEAKANKAWGVYDHNVFEYMFKMLSENNNPQFILCLTTTNHTPFELPEDYKPYYINPQVTKNPVFSVSTERCLELLTAFQYTNDALGKFMDKIKSSPLAENTIVIITGDHNIRKIIGYNTQKLDYLKFEVPLYLYIPETLKKTLSIDVTKTGSHYDIMTSIYPYILNNIKYFNLGQNLFSNDKPSESYYSINEGKLLFGKSLTYEQVAKIQRAREAILFYYYSCRVHESLVH